MKGTKVKNISEKPIFHKDMVISADGTPIGYRYAGNGPGVILLHGALKSSLHYEALAVAMADQYTVYIPDRRGRGDSGSAGDDYSITKEIEDLAALMDKTDAHILFGHDIGGLIALEAALFLPVDKLVLYEPAVSIQHSLPMNWLPVYEQALRDKQYAKAMATFIKGLPTSWVGKLPVWILQFLCFTILSDDKEEELHEVLPSMVWEGKLILHLDSMYERYAGIQADTLLLGGTQSPLYFLAVLPLLAEQISSVRVKLFPGRDHTSPDRDDPQLISWHTKDFLTNPATFAKHNDETNREENRDNGFLVSASSSLLVEE